MKKFLCWAMALIMVLSCVSVFAEEIDLQKAYDEALKTSIWEKLGKTNYKDVMAFKLLLKEDCETYLNAMHGQFIEAVDKYTR